MAAPKQDNPQDEADNSKDVTGNEVESKEEDSKEEAQPQEEQVQKDEKVILSEDEWKKKLTPMEYNVLRLKHTEPGDNRGYTKQYPKDGYYCCKACGNPLYSFAAKFDSGC